MAKPVGECGGTGNTVSPESGLEAILLWQIEAAGLPRPRTQYRVVFDRRWRFDLAWPDNLLAVECEGGVWSRGRHVRGKGYEEDCEKYNRAALLGWRVLRVTGGMIRDGRALEIIREALKGRGE